MALRFHRFQTRLLVFLLLPMVAVLLVVYRAVDDANVRNANDIIMADLTIGARNFRAALQDRNLYLSIAGTGLSGDYAFASAFNTQDHPTRLSAMENLLGRIEIADFIAMVDADSHLLAADTRRPDQRGIMPEWLDLIDAAEALDRAGEYPEAEDVVILDDRPYHLTILPFGTPDLVAWVVLGFEIDQDYTEEFKRSIAAEVSVLSRGADGNWRVGASTMPTATHAALAAAMNTDSVAGFPTVVSLGDADYVSLDQVISKRNADVVVVLQRSLVDQLKPFDALRQRLFSIFAVGVTALLAALLILSRNVTRPLLSLTAGARRIEAGDFEQRVETSQHDELGQLTDAFNNMAKGLAEKERVRTLLGKVVSPEIANELLTRQPELGGEEREVTVLFTDVRGFTGLCEGQSPKQILSLLNEYFSALTTVIEQHGGVVDKFIGDAVMALFGAPVPQPDAAARAIRAALAITPVLDSLNRSLMARGLRPIATGIGINTDWVVVGNMGSASRMNYTAIGDGVNLASRLEGLTKRYGVEVIISEATRQAAPEFRCLELDLVRVKGKLEPVRIFTPLAMDLGSTTGAQQRIDAFHAFLRDWQQGRFADAAAVLDEQLVGDTTPVPPALLALYRDRLAAVQAAPPDAWDGVFTHQEK